MLRSSIAHVRSSRRLDDGRVHAVSMFNRGAHGVLVWAGRLEIPAETKPVEELESGDFHMRETVSFMSWHDIAEFFASGPYAELIGELVTSHKRSEVAETDDVKP